MHFLRFVVWAVRDGLRDFFMIVAACVAIALIVIGLAICLDTRADAASVSLNVGAFEAVGTDGAHLGVFVGAGASVGFTVAPGIVVAPYLGANWSPESGHWGLSAQVGVDYALGALVGLDFAVGVANDVAGLQFDDALCFAGGGPGFSVFLGDWTVSPFVNLWANLADGRLAFIPGVNVAYTLRL